MENNKGHIIQSTIRPATSADTFPVIYSNEVLGGTHSYSTIYDRNNIPFERRKEGMFVNVTGSTYILSGGIDNSNWIYLPLNINSFGTGTTIFSKNEATGQNYIKTLSTKSPVLSITESNGVIFVDFLGGSGSANLSNDPYNYTTWISDGITGATRQSIAAKFNLNDTNITNLKNSLTGYTATTLNLINIKLDISDFNNYSANTLNDINDRLLISDFNTYTATTIDRVVTGATLTNSGTTLNLLRNDGINITVTGFTATDNTKLAISDFNTYSASTLSNINTRLLISNFNSYTANTIDRVVTGGTVTNSGSTLVLQRNDGVIITVTGFTATDNTKLAISDFNTYSANTLNNINTRLLISDFNNYSASTLSNINLRLLTTDFNNYSANTLTSINNKVTKGGDTGSLVIGTNNATTLNFITNNGIRQQIDSTGNVIFSGTTTLVSLNDLRILDNNGTSYFIALDSVVNNTLRIGNGWGSIQYQTGNHSFGSTNLTAINLFGSSSLNALRARGTTLDVGTGFTNILIPAIINLSATTTGNTASRMVETDIDGNIQGIEDIVPLQIFGYNVQSNLSNNNNWSGTTGVYSGNTTASTATTITGTYQGQFYDDTNWFYWMKENNVPIRLPKGSIIPRGLLINNNVINSSGSGITIFSSYNLSPFTLKFDGDEIDTEYYGKTIDVSASKRLRVFFNNQLVYNNENDGQYFGGNNINWKLNVKHIRVNNSGTTYHTGIFSIVNNGTYQNHVMNTTLTGNTFSNSINIRLEANDTSGNFANNQIQLTKIKYNPFI